MFVHVDTPEFIDLPARMVHNQRWYKTPEGVEYPSITTVLGDKPKPYLETWRNMLGNDKADKETKRCADRGTAVHEIAEKYINNEENYSKGYKAEYVRLFNQLKIRFGKINNVRAQELALYSDTLKVAGRVDLVAEYDGVLSIIDFKTSNNNKDEKMIQDYFKQCTAYAIMYHEMYGEPIEDIVIMMTVERGLAPLVFKKKIDDYVAPLLKDIRAFYEKRQK